MHCHAAELKFWNNPELITRLTLFLDGRSTFALAKAHPFALMVLQAKSTWNRLVRRVCPFSYGDQMETERVADLEERLAEVMAEVNHLVGILKMMDDQLDPLLLHLLELICERFPPVDSVPREARRALLQGTGFVMVNTLPGPQFFQVHCSRRDTSHKVSPFGFLILEQVQKEFSVTELMLERVVFDLMTDPWLSALESWLLRQKDGVGVLVQVLHVECYTTACAQALSTVMENCECFHIQQNLCIDEDVGTEGWTALRKGLASQKVRFLVCDKEDMGSGRREDLKAIWESLSAGWRWERGPLCSKDEHEWPLLEKYLDMSEKEWAKLFPYSNEDSSSDGEEDE